VTCDDYEGDILSLDLSSSSLTGSIPSSIGYLTGLEELDLSENSLSGLIPSTLVDIAGLKYLDLSSNYLRGRSPCHHRLSAVLLSSFLLTETI
jgi:hypothetical protein